MKCVKLKALQASKYQKLTRGVVFDPNSYTSQGSLESPKVN